MAYTATYTEGNLSETELPQTGQWALLEFGTNWCGHCMAAQNAIQQALDKYPELTHIKEEDGRGRPLGRHFHVKLWPTLILLNHGKEVGRLVRPTKANDISMLLKAITPAV